MRRIERAVGKEWAAADKAGKRMFPHEFLFKLLREGQLKKYYEIDPKDSWMIAAAEKNLPMFVPGWEDSTLGNMYAAAVISGRREKRQHHAQRNRVHDAAGGVVHDRLRRKLRLAFSRSAVALLGTFPSAWCRCFIRI